MKVYKIPFDVKHEEKIFRWLFIFKTSIIFVTNNNVFGNFFDKYVIACKNNYF